jgi:mitosis inhibitor protein kinase SWE1
LKPANILINQSGNLQISDFGLSIRLASLTSDGCPVIPEGNVNVREGDREYLSPEMLKGVYGTFSDVFSLGATMLEVAFNIVLPSSKFQRI